MFYQFKKDDGNFRWIRFCEFSQVDIEPPSTLDQAPRVVIQMTTGKVHTIHFRTIGDAENEAFKIIGLVKIFKGHKPKQNNKGYENKSYKYD